MELSAGERLIMEETSQRNGRVGLLIVVSGGSALSSWCSGATSDVMNGRDR